MTLEHTSIEAT